MVQKLFECHLSFIFCFMIQPPFFPVKNRLQLGGGGGWGGVRRVGGGERVGVVERVGGGGGEGVGGWRGWGGGCPREEEVFSFCSFAVPR